MSKNFKKIILWLLPIIFVSGCFLTQSNENIINKIKKSKQKNGFAYDSILSHLDSAKYYPCETCSLSYFKYFEINCIGNYGYLLESEIDENLKDMFGLIDRDNEITIIYSYKKYVEFAFHYIFKISCEDIYLTYLYGESPNIDSLYKGFEITKGDQIPEQDCNWVYIIDEHWIIANYSKD